MGRKKRIRRTKPSSPLIPTVADDGRRDGDGVNGEPDLSASVMTVEDIEQMNLENEVRLSIESEGYGAVKVECEKVLEEMRPGNHMKVIRLLEELCGKYEIPAYLALVYRVQGAVCVKVATITDDPNAKQRHLKSAIESAKKATMLSPGSVEFAHFYAKLIYETASDRKDYEDSARECERALAIKNPIDPGKESLLDETHQKTILEFKNKRISAEYNWIEYVQHELRGLLEWANLNIGFMGPVDVRVVQGRQPNDIKKENKTIEELKKKIKVKVAAARQLQHKKELALTQPEAIKAPEPSSETGPRTGERRKSGNVKKNTSSDERKEAVLPFWKSTSSDLKKGLFEIKISDFKSHFKSLKDGLQYDEVINEALSFGVDNNSWRFWMCCRCSEKFADPELHKHHVLHAHTESLSPELQAVLPPNVDSEWADMLLTFPWKALDVHDSVKMIELQSSSEEKKHEESCKIYSNPDSWPLSDDTERMKLLEKIKVLFQLLIRLKCLAASHLTKVIQFAVEELHPQLLNSGVEQSPICICFLGATELKKVSRFLLELLRSCGVGRHTEKGMEELNGVTQVSEIAEKIVIDKDGSSLLLDELSLPCDLSWNTREDNIGSEKRLAVDDDSLLSWIFSSPTSREQLTFWTLSREEKVHQGVELLDTLGKEFAHLQSLCKRKMDRISYEEAVQLVEDLCLEEGKRRENSMEFVPQSYKSVLRKRLHDFSESDSEVTPNNKFEVEVLTNVLKEADAFTASQFGYEDYGSVNSQIPEDDRMVNDSLYQLDTCIEVGIQKQKEHVSVELSKIDARIMQNVSGIKQLEAKIGPLCAHDFGLIVVPLIKSYLRAHIENLADKDATEKSDAAREAFLSELALDSKKGTGDIPKHSNDKLKDKRKNKEHRKSKDSRITGELHVSSHDNVSKASSTPPEIDEQPSDSDAETGAVLHQQEDEARRRKMELEAEERKLQETLEYQRRIEDEAKQRHLAEQLKSSSRMTPTGNPVDDKWEPSRLEPIKQNNGALSHLEDGLCNAKDGFPKRTGLLDGRQQSVSSGKETTEFGQVTFSDRLQGDSNMSSGDNGAVPLRLLQAEDDDDDEIGKSQNAQKSFSSQASGFGFEMGKDRHLDGSDESRAMGSTLGGQDEVQDANVDLPSESAVPATVDSPASLSSTKGKKHKGMNGQESTPLSPPSQNVYNSTDSHNEVGIGSSVPSGDALLSQVHSMQEIIAQVLSNQKEIQKQIPTMVANTITKEGWKIEAAIGKSLEKSYKANSDAVWARTQEEFAKQEKSNRDRFQQVSALVTNGYKDLLATFEKMLKKETSALVASVVRSITPIIEKTMSTAITEAFQRGVADKSVNQLEKSVNSKLEGSIARQIQTQFQTSGKHALQEALKSSMEASVVPAFEMSCKAMFDQVNATFQKGMIEHTSAAHQQVESAHSPLAIALRDAINSASSVTQSLIGELADGQRKLVALALAWANSESVNPLMEAPLDPKKELSRLVSEHKYEEAFIAALQRSDVWIVSWLCSQVDLQGLLTSNPLPLSQGVLLSLLQQLACDIGNDTSKKLAWMMDVVVAIKPSDSMIAMHVQPIFEQVKSILNHQVSIPTTSVAERSSIKIIMKLISSTLGTL